MQYVYSRPLLPILSPCPRGLLRSACPPSTGSARAAAKTNCPESNKVDRYDTAHRLRCIGRQKLAMTKEHKTQNARKAANPDSTSILIQYTLLNQAQQGTSAQAKKTNSIRGNRWLTDRQMRTAQAEAFKSSTTPPAPSWMLGDSTPVLGCS
ncbi:hypothetical protein CALVIDRAFT_537827 [Calocera viscosa TUFC12733]|uniref:Uncharacterized protein n=1 Tax=Calocera viscosa (strain TUFC12733) TaxID=1330018 RepID=A0A167LMH7_CALVF|nr:hypothetical protein CALVIDRAFT_537827 [Calocera viscosa TUFC12733]